MPLFHFMHNKYIFIFLSLLFVNGLAWAQAEIRVTDDWGQPVTLRAPAQRIISLAPHITENLYAIGAGDQVVGVVAFSDYPPEAQALPQVGDFANLNIERILSLKPDLVVAWIDGTSPEQLARLEAFGIPVLRESPDTFAEIAQAMRRLGQLAGRNGEAEAVAADIETRITHLQQRYGQQRPLHVFYQLWHKPLMTANHSQLVDRMIRLCGGKNLFASRPEVAPTVNLEAVIAADPDLILSAVEQHDAGWRETWEPWPRMRAVKYQHLYSVDADLVHRATARAVQGAEQICSKLAQVRAQLHQQQSNGEATR